MTDRDQNNKDLDGFISNLGIDVYGVAPLRFLIDTDYPFKKYSNLIIQKFQFAVVLGAQLHKLGTLAKGVDVSMFLEKAAFDILQFFENRSYYSFIIHTEDEFDPVRRSGLLSLKMLAKQAGLGWQGRSLLIISPKYGPLHRLIAILTNMPLQISEPLKNQCGTCSICVDSCPVGALKFCQFDDHPTSREDILDLETCLGDNGCDICIKICPFLK